MSRLRLILGPVLCLTGPPAQAACRQALGLILGPVLCLAGPPAQAACRQALALGLDISGSVDAVEYGLQREGLAQALGAAAVRDALLQQPDAPVRLTVFEWSGPTARTVILPWTAITDAAALDTARARIRTAPRSLQDQTTALGLAMLAGFAMLEAQPDCWTRTLDLSGDGIANTGPRPQDIPASRTPPGVTVNGLTIGTATPPGADDSTHPQGTGSGGGAALSDGAGLAAYFRAFVVRGPGAFVEQAMGFDDYAAAMERKLLRELKSLALSDATPARQ